MKKLLIWGTVGLLTAALLDPVIYATLQQPIPWFRDLLMGASGVGCYYLLIRFGPDL